jgi:hypothetical protein
MMTQNCKNSGATTIDACWLRMRDVKKGLERPLKGFLKAPKALCCDRSLAPTAWEGGGEVAAPPSKS